MTIKSVIISIVAVIVFIIMVIAVERISETRNSGVRTLRGTIWVK